MRAIYREYFLARDFQLLHWLNHHHLPYSLPLLKCISSYTTHFSIATMLMVLALGFIHKSRALKIKFLILVAVFAFNNLLTQLSKHIINRERPGYCFTSIDRIVDGGGPSFPSGHSSEVAALAVSMMLLFSGKRRYTLFILWALLVAYSRMALGVHYPSDVAAGLILGGVIGWSVTTFSIAQFLAEKESIVFHTP